MKKILFLFFPYIFLNVTFSQEIYNFIPSKTIKLFLTDSVIFLPDKFIKIGSEVIFFKDSSILKSDYYKINYLDGILDIKSSKIKDDSIFIFYYYYPLTINSKFYKNYLREEIDSTKIKYQIIQQTSKIQESSDIFGNNINKSGSLIRSFSFGSNKDFTLNSGFRMQLNGTIFDDITITASLSDETTPILPEGNTQTIKEIDKIFININHKNFNMTLGDFLYENRNGFDDVIKRKLQGAQIEYQNNSNNINAFYGITPGKFFTNQFLARDAVQGPYKLYSENGYTNILVIPGSERVYLNGLLLKRGESEDYVIDYSTGEITFTVKNILKNNSRIFVEFEYKDNSYEKIMFGISTNTNLFKNSLNSSITFIQESDDYNSPVDFEMTQDIKEIIKKAGGNKEKSYIESIKFVGIDSLTNKGKGQYVLIDTIINNNEYKYYYYNPGAIDALYSIRFSYVGEGKGDYIRESYGVFKWVGIKKGSYLPITLLSIPERKRYAFWNVSYLPDSNFFFTNNFSLSNYNKNIISNNENDLNGIALNTKFHYSFFLKELFGTDLGKIILNFSNYYLSENYTNIMKNNPVNYFYDWNINDSTINKKNILSFNFQYIPIEKLIINYEFANNKYGNNNNANRNLLELSINETTFPDIKIKFQKNNNNELSFKNSFYHFDFNSEYRIDKFNISLNFFNENKEIKSNVANNLIDGYKILSFNPTIGYFFNNNSVEYELEYREDYIPYLNSIVKESYRYINKFNINFHHQSNLYTQLIGGFQKRIFTENFNILNNSNQLNLFLKSYNKYSNNSKSLESNVFYEASSQYSAKSQKIYLRVEKGKGNYIYLGDINSNGIADENEFQQVKYDGEYIPVSVKTDELLPVTNIKTSFRIKINPDRIFKRNESFIENLLSNFSSETNYQINETNKYKKNSDIFLLKMSKFLNDSLTLTGNQNFIEDFFLLEKNKYINIRYRYYLRKNLTQYNYGIEKRNSFERSIRIRFNFANDITNETNLISSNEYSISDGNIERNFKIKKNVISSIFYYRPISNFELSFSFTNGKKNEDIQKIESPYNEQSFGINYSFLEKGNLNISIERNEILLKPFSNTIPYTLTDGKNIGISWILNVDFNYKINNFTNCNFSYIGRKPQEKNIIHYLNFEIKLIF
jgi:hypothetical protein